MGLLKRKTTWAIVLFGSLVSLGVVIIATIAVLFSQQAGCQTPAEENGNVVIAGVSGEWTKPGTKANATAKAVFDYWIKKGMSGAQAAGIVGNIGGAEDKGFVLDQREFGGGPGGGLYQFTPYTKYLNNAKSDKSWSVENQGDVVIALEPQTIRSFFTKTKSSSPEDAATDWMNLYERPSAKARALTNNDRRSAAVMAYQLFGGSNLSANDSLLGATISGGQAGSQVDASTNSCSTSSVAGGNWGWPFASIKNNNPSIGGEQLFGASGSRIGGFHNGVDFGNAAYGGQDILAVHGGTVVKIGHQGVTQNDLGYYVVTKADDYYVIYQEFAFSQSQADQYIKVKEGDTVQTGQKIGYLPRMGESGPPEVTHIHIGVSDKPLPRSGAYVDDGHWFDVTKLIKGNK